VYTRYIQLESDGDAPWTLSSARRTLGPSMNKLLCRLKARFFPVHCVPGEMLPSMRLLARQLHISVITTRRAYSDLESEGFLETVAGKGCFVTRQNVERIREEQRRRTEELLRRAVEQAKQSGISAEDLHRMVDGLYAAKL
jgi:GntR family transcriptional regulator